MCLLKQSSHVDVDMNLIQTFPPQADESGRGYYRRLSAANALSSWKDLARHSSGRASFDALLVHPDHVSKSLKLELDWCLQATAQDDFARSWRGVRRVNRDAVCIPCLREAVYLRAHWEHAYMVACPTHDVLLLDTCPLCEQPLRLGREHIASCDCGFDMRAATPKSSTSAQRWVSTLVAHGRADGVCCGPGIEEAGPSVASRLISTLSRQPDPLVISRRQNASSPSSIDELVAFLRPLETLLADWPANFKKHVSLRLRDGPADGRTLNSRLGSWYQQLRKLSDHRASHPFLDVIAQVSEVEFDGVIGLDAATKIINRTATHVLLLEASARIGITHSSLLNYHRKGSLPSKAIKVGTNGRVYQVEVTEVNEIIRARQQWTSEEEVCAILGIPPGVLSHLCDAGEVIRDARWKEDLRKGGPFELASIHRFVLNVRSSVDTRQDDGRRIKLRDLSAKHVGDKGALARALQAISSGEIPAANGGDGLVGDYEYLWDAVAKHHGRPMLSQGQTVQGLAQATGYKHESISNWIGQGLLKSFEVLLRGQPCRVVTPLQFVEFRRQFVPLSDLAKEMGTKSSALARQLNGIEILGAQVLPGGERRGGLVRMADLGRAAIQNAVSHS